MKIAARSRRIDSIAPPTTPASKTTSVPSESLVSALDVVVVVAIVWSVVNAESALKGPYPAIVRALT